MIRTLIAWAVKRSGFGTDVINSNNVPNMRRFAFLFPDEFWCEARGRMINKRPFFAPFNAFLHCWRSGDTGHMHDHPRWSITIVLQGMLWEETPNGVETLTPGSVVFRKASAIHRIVVPEEHRGRTWTLFIVGRRKHAQHYYNNFGEPVCSYADMDREYSAP